MGKVSILSATTEMPITTIGERAGVCWGADTSDPVKNYQRGWDCIISGHGRTLEYVNIEMVLDGYSARVMREWYTHIGGAPTRLQASTRYINYEEFGYIMPKSIAANEVAGEEYQDAMRMIGHTINMLTDMGIPREDAAMLLPLGMTTRVVDKRNLRNLIDMSRQRMCNRAYWEFRQMFSDICDALSAYCAENGEWETIVRTQLYPKCEPSKTCPEARGCGKYPKVGGRRG
ncbi:MAG: FAD-dependent thymidylate synthase [Bacteroidales bacterium]|nr:FAD-dependent thymidylate synthase [Bacteroidales bacterium]